MEPIYIRMLGEFALEMGENRISDSDNRSKKVWLLLAYLLCHRGRVLSQKELIELLWGSEPNSSNPENALKITFHRLRSALDQLFPSAGRQLILRRDGGYTWNNQIPVTLDYQQFEQQCQRFCADPAPSAEDGLTALELYQGDFLQKLCTESWVIPIVTHYHNLYVQTALALLPLLQQQQRHQEMAQLCRRVLTQEPYHEQLHRYLMQALAALGDQKGVVSVYEELSRRLFDDFGIYPEEETRAVYRSAAHAIDDRALPIDQVLAHLQEQESLDGAMQCEYDYFKILCHAESRAMERSGRATHIALLSVSGDGDNPLSRRSMNTAMENLGHQIRTNLRRGDSFTRCSLSQYILLLPQANYENSCMVCRRITGAFGRKHPHSPAKLHYMVQPLTPDTMYSKFQ